MSLYYYLFLIIPISIIILVIRFYLLQKRNTSVELFFEALKDENNGDFEAAVVTYESALKEVKKIRFHNDLKNEIIDKLKTLHTSIEFANSLR